MTAAVWLRRAFFALVVLLLVYAVVGMFLTGPVVVRLPRITLDVDPSPGQIRTAVERLCSDLAPRDFEHRGNLDRAALWIAEQFEYAGLDVELQDYRLESGLYRNVIGRRPGSDPESEAIVIGAHYDTVRDSPGADDNASGVAVLLELVRTLPDVDPARTHYFVAFSTEEPPFFGSDEMGSAVFAQSLADAGERLRLMLSLDLVGYYSDEPGSQRFPFPLLRLFYPSRGNFVAVIGDAASGEAIERAKRGMLIAGRLPVRSFRAPRSTGVVHMSDHQSFRRLDFPAVQVTDTAFMRYPHYHRPEDLPDKLDYERMAELVRMLHGVLWEGD